MLRKIKEHRKYTAVYAASCCPSKRLVLGIQQLYSKYSVIQRGFFLFPHKASSLVNLKKLNKEESMKKVSCTGAKVQIHPPSRGGGQAARCMELDGWSWRAPGRQSHVRTGRQEPHTKGTRRSRFGKALKSGLTSIPIQNCTQACA